MGTYDKLELVNIAELSEHLGKSESYIDDNKEYIIGAIKIGYHWRFNLNLIRYLISINQPFVYTKGKYYPNHIKTHETHKLEYVSVPFYRKRLQFVSVLTHYVSILNNYNRHTVNVAHARCLLDCIFHSSQTIKRHFEYDNMLLALPFLNVKLQQFIAGPRPDYFRAEVGGGPKHREMAKLIMRHCKNTYGYEPEIEIYHMDKRVDIFDVGRGIIYEIGDTDPTAVYKHFFDSEIKAVYIIPFQPHDDNYIYGVKLSPSIERMKEAYDDILPNDNNIEETINICH